MTAPMQTSSANTMHVLEQRRRQDLRTLRCVLRAALGLSEPLGAGSPWRGMTVFAIVRGWDYAEKAA